MEAGLGGTSPDKALPGLNLGRLTLKAGVVAGRAADGSLALTVAPGDATSPGGWVHSVELELEAATVSGLAAGSDGTRKPGRKESETANVLSAPDAEPVSGGDPNTLRRRIELLLGGPPGFTTGARAEILIDLLREFGRPHVIETLSRDWVSQFDTGPSASSSVTKPPPAPGDNGAV